MKRQIGYLPTFFLVVLLSGLTTGLVLWMHPVSTMAMIKAMLLKQPVLLLLNYLPLFLLILSFTCLLRNVFFATGLVGFVTALMSVANRVKIQIRDEPLVPRDFGLLKEAADAAGNYDLRLPWMLIGCVVVFAAIMIALGILLPTKAPDHQYLVRLAGFAASALALLLSVRFLYSSSTLYNSFSVTNPYYLTSVSNELGFPYYFCYHFSTYQVQKPEGYSKAQAAAWETDDSAGQGKDVHVIVVMNEAFSDLTNYDVFQYSGEDDPLKQFNALRKGENAVSGALVVPGYAGGTANTEFDVATGMQTNNLHTTSAFRSFNRNLDSVFRVFGADGYHTVFMHPGDAWFYNRQNVYRWLGADEILFSGDFVNSVSRGRWVTDDTVAENIILKFEEAVSGGQTLFDYAVTIQNHMSYTADKYGESGPYPAVPVDLPLSKEAQTLLSVYVEGLRDADAMLKTLTDYFSASDEPVVLAFFGDHLPYLGDDRLCYRELGLPMADDSAENFTSYETPYLIWCNDAAAVEVDLNSLSLPADGQLSACYLGAVLLELTGRGEESAWFSYLNELRRQLPVMQNGVYETMDGTVTSSPEQTELISKYLNWSYYKLKDKKVS
ncbi:LTA synthase family protein [Dysosmobacter acutus]|nr:LTA synthase family protein [Dysosmobacter acutus]